MTRYEPHCDCNGGHCTMIPDPNGQWCRAEVKPLEWTRGWMAAEAQSALGIYRITYERDGTFRWIIGEHRGFASSWDAAKAAAQSDFEARILSAFVEADHA